MRRDGAGAGAGGGAAHRSVTASMDGEADRTADRGASGAAKPHAVGEASESMVQIPTQIVTARKRRQTCRNLNSVGAAPQNEAEESDATVEEETREERREGGDREVA